MIAGSSIRKDSIAEPLISQGIVIEECSTVHCFIQKLVIGLSPLRVFGHHHFDTKKYSH